MLVLVDGHFGFEMETFELLNVLQVGDSFARALRSALTSVYAVRAPFLGARWRDIRALQVHGFPKVMGILTHLDQFTNTKQLKKTKKQLKANQIACVCLHAERTASNRRELELLELVQMRFWTEIYDGAKLFYFSGLKCPPQPHILSRPLPVRPVAARSLRTLLWFYAHALKGRSVGGWVGG